MVPDAACLRPAARGVLLAVLLSAPVWVAVAYAVRSVAVHGP